MDLDEWAVLDALAALVDHSLVQVQTDRRPVADTSTEPWTPRYRLAETARLYAKRIGWPRWLVSVDTFSASAEIRCAPRGGENPTA